LQGNQKTATTERCGFCSLKLSESTQSYFNETNSKVQEIYQPFQLSSSSSVITTDRFKSNVLSTFSKLPLTFEVCLENFDLAVKHYSQGKDVHCKKKPTISKTTN
jgi:exopolysaccharide biosynthesis predicted pyruvyltransferase EpsI